MSAGDWFYATGDEEVGPVSYDQLREQVAAGVIGKRDLIWQVGTADWVEAGTQPDLFERPKKAATKKAATKSGRDRPKWFYVENDAEVGPITAAELEDKVRSGELTARTEVWKEGLPEWIAIEKVKGLRSALKAASRSSRSQPNTSRSTKSARPKKTKPAAVKAPESEGWLDNLDGLDADDLESGEALPPPQAVVVAEPTFGLYQPLTRGNAPDREKNLNEFYFAGFFKRTLGWIVDTVLIAIVTLVIYFVFFLIVGVFGAAAEGAGAKGLLGVVPVVVLLMTMVLSIAPLVYMGQGNASDSQGTLGKQFAGVIVTDFDGNPISLGRSYGRAIAQTFVTSFGWVLLTASNLFGWNLSTDAIGIWTVGPPIVQYGLYFFTPRQQTMHDIIAGTQVLDAS